METTKGENNTMAKLDVVKLEKKMKTDAIQKEKQAKLDAVKLEKKMKTDAIQQEKQAKLDAVKLEKKMITDAIQKEQAKQDAEQTEQQQKILLLVTAFITFISTVDNPKIILLREKEVVQWLFGDLSFLPKIEKKNKTEDEKKYKILEDKWGQDMLKKRRPDLRLDKQWTNKFGEHLCEELYTLLGKVVTKPIKKENFQPDSEIDDFILEAKAQTFYTSGTAGEKILGVPLKYSKIPRLYGKGLRILCMGGAEKECRENYGNLPGPKMCAETEEIIDFYRLKNIEYVGATDILLSLIPASE
jgi:hypothetical protein